jgi:hypothetical protein
MCVGRLVSVVLARLLQPAALVCTATAACLLAAFLLLLLAPGHVGGFYAGLAGMGFFVSWQFGTGFSWTARHASLTGRLSSLLFIGERATVFFSEDKFTDLFFSWSCITQSIIILFLLLAKVQYMSMHSY